MSVQYVFFFQVSTVKEASFFSIKDVDLMYREQFCLYNRRDSERMNFLVHGTIVGR